MFEIEEEALTSVGKGETAVGEKEEANILH